MKDPWIFITTSKSLKKVPAAANASALYNDAEDFLENWENYATGILSVVMTIHTNKQKFSYGRQLKLEDKF